MQRSLAGVEAELRLDQSCKECQELLSEKIELEGQLKRARHLAQRLQALPPQRVRNFLQGASTQPEDGKPAAKSPSRVRQCSLETQQACSVSASHVMMMP
jgi:hypothetical protein